MSPWTKTTAGRRRVHHDQNPRPFSAGRCRYRMRCSPHGYHDSRSCMNRSDVRNCTPCSSSAGGRRLETYSIVSERSASSSAKRCNAIHRCLSQGFDIVADAAEFSGPPPFRMAFSLSDYAKGNVLAVQEYSALAARAVANLFSHPRYLGDMLVQMDVIGVGSLPITVLTGFFTGAVLALQSANSLARFGALSFTGQLVSMSMVRELGPVLTSLMVAGRNSSGMASELGSMVVTEQIDAMRALGTDPSRKLVTPRVVATVIMLFFLTIISDLIGLTGGSMVAMVLLGLD